MVELSRCLTITVLPIRKHSHVGRRCMKEKAEVKLAAEMLEADSTGGDERSDKLMHLHHRRSAPDRA